MQAIYPKSQLMISYVHADFKLPPSPLYKPHQIQNFNVSCLVVAFAQSI